MIKKQSAFLLQTRFCDRFINTFLQFPILWRYVINYDKGLKKSKSRFVRIIRIAFLKVFWFWPRVYDALEWSEGSIGGRRNPDHFVDIKNDEYLLVDEVDERASGYEDIILDLGCNSGRFLNNLYIRGYTNLRGVDISRAALDNMGNVFPELYQNITTSCMTFQEFLYNSADNTIDVLFSRGATVELVHPSFPLIYHICRVTKKTVVFMINESGHSYPRFWEWEFNKQGFVLSKVKRPLEVGNGYVSLMVFNNTVELV